MPPSSGLFGIQNSLTLLIHPPSPNSDLFVCLSFSSKCFPSMSSVGHSLLVLFCVQCGSFRRRFTKKSPLSASLSVSVLHLRRGTLPKIRLSFGKCGESEALLPLRWFIPEPSPSFLRKIFRYNVQNLVHR